MKKIIGVLAVCATLGLTAPLASVSELKAQTPAAAAAQGACTDESKAAWYADFTKNRTTDAAKAYDAAKKYLAACSADVALVKAAQERVAKPDATPAAKAEADAELKRLAIPVYLGKWVIAYEKEARHLKLNDLFLNQKKYAEALTLAKEILADEPDYLPATIDLGYGGYVVAVTTKNESGNAEAISYAKKAIQAIESGKAPENWVPFKSKDDALGYLYYSVGYLQRTSNPSDALTNFIKAAQFDGEIKKNAQTYALIGAVYESDYAKQSEEYQKKYGGQNESPESKLAVANINQVVDRIIDALARAVSVSGTDANAQTQKTQWLGRLTELYKFRKGSEAGLNEMIAGVMSKPLPPIPTPLKTLPDTPAATTTPTTGAMNTGGPAPPNAAAPGTGTSAAAPAKSATTAPATASTKPAAKSKTRNNHPRP